MTMTSVLVLLLPLVTAAIVAAVALREDGTAVPWRRGLPLVGATAAALLVLPAMSSSVFALYVAFAVLFLLTFPVTSAIAASASVAEDGKRVASLEPRRVDALLPRHARVVSLLFLVAALLWVFRVFLTSGVRNLVVFSFPAIALAFFLLYEVWMRQEVGGVRTPAPLDRERRVRTIFAAQFVLTMSFLVGAALSVREGLLVPITVAAALIGCGGCAYALSTGVQKRHLEAAVARRRK